MPGHSNKHPQKSSHLTSVPTNTHTHPDDYSVNPVPPAQISPMNPSDQNPTIRPSQVQYA